MGLFLIVLMILIIDIYTFKGLKLILSPKNRSWLKNLIYFSFWAVSALMILVILAGYFLRSYTRNGNIYIMYFYFFGAFLVIYLPKLLFIIFHLFDDLLFSFKWVYYKLTVKPDPELNNGNQISRSKFLTQIGLIVASVPFVSLIGGIVKGRFNFKVVHLKLPFPDLPKSFNGIKIVQISDIHIGSFKGSEQHV